MKSGFAVLIGRSNVGKSTLLNSLVGTKVAITSPVPQTSRDTVQGVIHRPPGEIIFVDTPGIFQHTHDAITKKLTEKAKDALHNIDVIVYVVDPTRSVGPEEQTIQKLVRGVGKPIILVINKTDRPGRYHDSYLLFEKFAQAKIEISAKHAKNIEGLINLIFSYLPVGEPLYPEEQKTNADRTYWLSEIIREKAFMVLREELPFSVHVRVNDYQERDNGMIYIHATLLTHTKRYKGMIIGKGGQTIKQIGQMARKELELAVQKKVYLELDVEVHDWTREI